MLFERLNSLESKKHEVFFVGDRNEPVTFAQIIEHRDKAKARLEKFGVGAGHVVALPGDYQLESFAFLLALIELKAIIVPLAPLQADSWPLIKKLVQAEYLVDTFSSPATIVRAAETSATHPIYAELRNREHAGLVLLSSGTTGQPKAVVHDFELFLKRFSEPPRPLRSVAFMRFDHVGGIYNFFSCLFNLGFMAYSLERTPDKIGELIQKHRLEFLPASASFLNILLVSRPWEKFDLSSLKFVVYGTERANPATIKKISAELPLVKFHQNYGLSEIGLLRSVSKGNDSVWLKIKDDQAQVRVRDGILEVRSELTMLGYLNADHQITDDGWYVTGDLAEEHDGWLKVIGRKSDLIRVAGLGVHPAEIEDIIMQMPQVIDVVVGREDNLLIGEVVVATVQVAPSSADGASASDMRKQVREFCAGRMDAYKIPSKIIVTGDILYGTRFKKKRLAR